MRILALVNQKGGCGKTTTAVHLASQFAALGRRTVLVDLDPQGHATLGLGVAAPRRERSIAAVIARSGLDEAAIPLPEILVPVGENLFLAPAGAELAELETVLARVPGGEERLAEHLASISGLADRVVIDAPPSLGMLTLNALTAAHEAVVPVEPSLYALHGLARLVEIARLLSDRNRHPVRIRVLINAFDPRTRFAQQIRDEIRRTFPEALLAATIRPSVRVREAAARGTPVDRFAPSAPVAADYQALADELERRADEAAAGRTVTVAGLVAGSDGIYISRNDVPPEQVRLAGDFNGWQPDAGVVLDKREDGSWTKFVPLGPGRYEYRLVVGGRWMTDPLNPRKVSNSLGSTNSVVEIEA